jgi:hypothetical protein
MQSPSLKEALKQSAGEQLLENARAYKRACTRQPGIQWRQAAYTCGLKHEQNQHV